MIRELEFPAEISYYVGDAAYLYDSRRTTVIFHCCNDIKRWGKGFVVPLGNWYPKAREEFLNADLKLGDCQLVEIEENKLLIANLVGQHGIYLDEFGNPPIRYEALEQAMQNMINEVDEYFRRQGQRFANVTFQCPRLGCGLAGGEWENVEEIIRKVITNHPDRCFRCCVEVIELPKP